MDELVLYTNPQSRGRIAHWMVEEIGQPYRTVWLGYGGPMKSPEYRAINPMGKVPAVTLGPVVVTEAAAICAWLADRFPQAGLAPPVDSPARATYFRWMFFAAGPLEASVAARSLGWQVPEGKNSMVGFGSHAEVVDALEQAVSVGPYLCGDQFTAADVYVGAQIGWGMMFGGIEKRPAFEAYFARISQRPASQRADRINQDHLESLKKA